MKVYFGLPMMGKEEWKAAEFALRKKRYLTSAGQVAAFEEAFQNFVGGGNAVAVSSCTAALHLALLAYDIGPGDEVIVPALTFVAMAHVVEAVGAKPVFVDAHPESGNIDPDLIEEKITKNTRAISVVHLLGRACHMRSILDIARRHDLPVIEDCALALGSKHWEQHVGLIGDIGCFSFYPVKHITTGEGGILLTKHSGIAEKARRQRGFGRTKSPYDCKEFGLNYRMTEMQGAIGQVQLKRLPGFLKTRHRNYMRLRARLDLERIDSDCGSHYAFSVMLDNRDDVAKRLISHHVETSIYYPVPVPHLTYYREKYGKSSFPVAEEISRRNLTLPVGPHLSESHVEYLIERVRTAL